MGSLYYDAGSMAVSLTSTTAPLVLPQTQLLRFLRVEVSVVVSNPGGGSTITQDALAKCLNWQLWLGNNVQLDLNGQRMKFLFETLLGVDSDYTEIVGTAGAQTGTWNFSIPMSDPRIVANPDATMADMRLTSNPRLQVTYNGAGTISATGGFTVTSITVTVACDLVVLPADAPKPRGNWLASRRWKEKLISTLSASTNNQKVNLNFGDLIRYYMFFVSDNATPPVRSNSLVANVQLSPNYYANGLRRYTDMRVDTRDAFKYVPATGVAIYDFDPGKNLNAATMLDMRGALANEAIIGTNAAASGINLYVVEEDIDPPDPDSAQMMKAYFDAARG